MHLRGDNQRQRRQASEISTAVLLGMAVFCAAVGLMLIAAQVLHLGVSGWWEVMTRPILVIIMSLSALVTVAKLARSGRDQI